MAEVGIEIGASEIELRGLGKRYGDSDAVRDLSVTFPAGRLSVLIGPSGSGKTTTLRMINRLITPSSGQVLIGGEDAARLPEVALRRRIGYVIQQIGLFPHLNVARNVATVPELLGWDRVRVQARVHELLELVGLPPEQFAHKRPDQLSGGQAQRVGVARALAADPPVVLMDEPFGALDPIARAHLQAAFRDIQRRLAKTVVMVTHDIDEALNLGDHVALMHGGTLAQFGTPDDLVRRPASDFVRRFVGEDAYLRRLASRTARALAGSDAGDPAWPLIADDTDARGALAVMLREGAGGVRLQGGGSLALTALQNPPAPEQAATGPTGQTTPGQAP